MNFLNKLVIPESAEHLELLRYLLVIVNLLFVTYASIALVAAAASVISDWRGKKSGDKTLCRFARDLADLAAPNRGVIYALIVLPLITAILIYTQLLYGMNLHITSYLGVASLFFFVGFYFLYGYKKSFHFDSIYSTFQSLADSQIKTIQADVAADVNSYERSALAVRRRWGRRSAILIFIGTWIFVGTTRLAFTPNRWAGSTFFTAVFSGDTIWSLITFIITALAMTSAAVLFFFFKWEKGIVLSADPSYKSFVKSHVLPVGILAAALEPVLIYFEIQNVPQAGVSNMTFVIAGAGMFIALLLMLLFYSMLKEADVSLGGYAFVGVIALLVIWATKDEIAFQYATRDQNQVLATRYQTMLAALSPETAQPVISGEDIYNTICSACHRFDRKLVGPPYFQTLPHFVGKMDSLEDFINNPYQAVPGYPPMPKQPLKPAEVKAVANYIMSVYLQAAKEGKAKVIE